ncbi:unnamed protein product, partial [Brenthis ino]
MSDRERDRSASRRGSRSPSHERRSDRDRSDSRRRERSPDENTRLRLEMRTMIARLSALENKSRATSIPARSSEHMAGSGVRDVLVSENVHDRSPSRRRQTRLLGRNISRSPDRTVSRSVRRPLSPRCRSRSPNKYTTSRSRDHVLPTREVNQRRRSRSRSPRHGSEVDASMHSTITDRIVDVINSINNADAEDEESTTPSVTQPYNVDVPGDASEPQPSTSGTQIHGEEPAASPTFTSSDDSTEPSMPMLETDLQS